MQSRFEDYGRHHDSAVVRCSVDLKVHLRSAAAGADGVRGGVVRVGSRGGVHYPSYSGESFAFLLLVGVGSKERLSARPFATFSRASGPERATIGRSFGLMSRKVDRTHLFLMGS